jgi:hypothetical protein
MMWRALLQESAVPLQEATYVCVDLPGYGGSDNFDKYDTAVLEALAEFISAMRDTFLAVNDNGEAKKSTYIVAHDWGAILALRLAAEAPSLADRFIITNGPHIELTFANRDRIWQSSQKIFKQFRQSPWKNFGCLGKSIKTLGPLITQIFMFGYIASFHLPIRMVRYLGTGGNLAFIRGVHTLQQGKRRILTYSPEALACTLGPSQAECTINPEDVDSTNGVNGVDTEVQLAYGHSVLERAKSPGALFWEQTCYYRDGVSYKPWRKSLEVIADLHALSSAASQSSSPARRRSSSSASSALLNPQYKGVLNAPATILWGAKDMALSKEMVSVTTSRRTARSFCCREVVTGRPWSQIQELHLLRLSGCLRAGLTRKHSLPHRSRNTFRMSMRAQRSWPRSDGKLMYL